MSALVVSRFELKEDAEETAEQMFASYAEEIKSRAGFLSTSVWQHHARPTAYMRISHFASVRTFLHAYDRLAESGFLEKAVLSYSVVPDVRIFEVAWAAQMELDEVHMKNFVSISDRMFATVEMADEWIAKLSYNFDEIRSIPGFDGALIARGHHYPEETIGIACWRSARAYEESVPPNPDYTIELYERWSPDSE